MSDQATARRSGADFVPWWDAFVAIATAPDTQRRLARRACVRAHRASGWTDTELRDVLEALNLTES